MSLDAIPVELREVPKWVVANAKKVPFDPKTGKQASVTDPSTWGSFPAASKCLNIKAYRENFVHIGWVLTLDDPFTVIDLDVKEGKSLTPFQQSVLDEFRSYAERSQSGRGYHIVIKGKLSGDGIHDDDEGVEVYSTGRYMIFTGDVARDMPVTDCQKQLDALESHLRKDDPKRLTAALVEDGEQVESDDAIDAKASGASNCAKFIALRDGQWEALGYPSQSEADYAFLSMLSFYSPSNVQVKRMFRNSALGQREKATKDDKYLDRCIAKLRANAPPPVDATALLERAALVGGTRPPSTSENSVTQTTAKAPIVFPPGLVGDLAGYFYSSAIRPVPEVALATAIAFTAGIVGRPFNTWTRAGLNLYVVLLAKTGRGKEGAKKAAMRIVNTIRPTVPSIMDFIGPAHFASGEGLLKHLDVGSKCFVCFFGEVGHTLSKVTSDNANEHNKEFKTQLLNLYSLSGMDGFLGTKGYANAENNTKSVRAPSFSFVGDSTPDIFFACLDDSRLSDGLIPRLLVIEYLGDRPPENPDAGHAPPDALVEAVKALAIHSLTLASRDVFVPVPLTSEAKVVLHQFRDEADFLINNAGAFNEQAEAWNRAYENSLKLATLAAVGANLYNPEVTEEHASWAIALVRRSVETILGRFNEGEVGGGDGTKAEALIKRAVLKYLVMTPEQKAKDPKIPKGMQTHEPFLPYAYLSDQVRRLAPFKHKDWLLRSKLDDLVKSGVLTKVSDRGILTRLKVRDGEVYTLGENCDWRST